MECEHGRYFLLRESMLDSVLVARDRFLAPGGSLFPSHARLYLAPMRSTHAHHRKAEFQVHIQSLLRAQSARAVGCYSLSLTRGGMPHYWCPENGRQPRLTR